MDAPRQAGAQFQVGASNSEQEQRAARLRTAVNNAGGPKTVSTRSGVPLSTLNTYLNGQDMKLSTALALAQACDISIEFLISGDEASNPLPRATPAMLRFVNTDRLATAITLIDKRLPLGSAPRDRAVAIAALYDIISPMDDGQIKLLVEQQNSKD